MKHMIFNKILRNDKNTEAPIHWPNNIKKIEQEALELKKISQDIVKRLSLCPVFYGCHGTNLLISSTTSVWNNPTWSKSSLDNDKSSKKLPEQNLANFLLLSGERLSILNPQMSKILSAIGETSHNLAVERLKWAANMESNVIDKLRKCHEDSVPALVKNRRQLWKQSTDLKNMQEKLRSLENNSSTVLSPSSPLIPPHNSSNNNSDQQQIPYNQNVPPNNITTNSVNQNQSLSIQTDTTSPTTNHSSSSSSTSTNIINSTFNCVSVPQTNDTNNIICNNNIPSSTTVSNHENNKLTQLKNSRDDLENQIDHLKDISLREHYRFESSTVELSRALVNMLRNEATYHQQCLKMIGEVLPELESSIANNPIPVFGRELSQHLLTSGRHIAYTIEVCIRHLDNPDIYTEEGLFRIAGGKNKVDTLSSAFNVFRADKIIQQYDHYVVADCLKQYLRCLPDPLLTRQLFDEWIQAVNCNTEEEVLEAMKLCLSKMPPAYFNNLSYLMGFLYKLTTFSQHNRMVPASLGIIFGPTLLSNYSNSKALFSPTTPTTNSTNVINSGSQTVGRKKARSISNSAASQLINVKRCQNNNSTGDSITTANSNKVTSIGALDLVEFSDSNLLNQTTDDDSSDLNASNNNNNMTKSMISNNQHNVVIETLIKHFKYLFPNQTTQFSSNIPPKVFPATVSNHRSRYHDAITISNHILINGSNELRHQTPQLISKPIKLERRMSADSSTTDHNNNNNDNNHLNDDDYDDTTSVSCKSSAKSSATTPTGKKTLSTEFRNGTVFPSNLYRRRVSDTTLNGSSNMKKAPVIVKANRLSPSNRLSRSNNISTADHGRFIGSVDISDLPDIDSTSYGGGLDEYGSGGGANIGVETRIVGFRKQRYRNQDDGDVDNDGVVDYDEEEQGAGEQREIDEDFMPKSITNSAPAPPAKYVPKSFHADVYDTLFALQSLKNTFTMSSASPDAAPQNQSNSKIVNRSSSSCSNRTDDYLSRVRSVYEGRTLSKVSPGSRTPLVRRQTFNTPTVEESMSKSVTNDPSISQPSLIPTSNLVSDSSQHQPRIKVVRRNKPSVTDNLTKKPNNKYRESSPATIETVNDFIFFPTNPNSNDNCTDDSSIGLHKNKNHNTFPNKPMIDYCESDFNSENITPIRYSMPLLPTNHNNPTNRFAKNQINDSK